MLIRLYLSRPATAAIGAEFAASTLRGIARANQDLISRGIVPPLYQSGVRYQREPAGVETFADAHWVYQHKSADCSSLAAYRLGELWAAGETGATIYLRWRGYDDGGRLYHVMVRRADNSLEDPSRLLGM